VYSSCQRNETVDARPYSKAISIVIEDAEHVLTGLGLIAAGIWAYYNYFRGRTYRPRLEPEITASLRAGRECWHLMIAVIGKNVGLSKVDIKQEGTVVTVLAAAVPGDLRGPRELDWSEVRFVTVLSDHAWVEPGEEIMEKRLLAMPGGSYPIYRVELRIASAVGQTWTASTIATHEADCPSTALPSPSNGD